VFIYSATYNNNDNNRHRVIQLPYPSDDTRLISTLARNVIRQLFRPGVIYMKAGIGLVDLSSKKYQQLDLFHSGQSVRTDQLMQVMDKINSTYGKNTLYIAAEGVHKKWAMRQAYRSPAYTSCWNELPIIKC